MRKIILSAFLGLAYLFLSGQDVYATMLWTSSFESGSIDENLRIGGGAGGAYNSGTWDMTLSQDVAHSGNKSVKMTLHTAATNSNGIRLFRMQESRTRQPFYYSAWYYFPLSFETPAGWWNIMQFKSVNAAHNDPFWLIDIIARNGKMYPRLTYWPPDPDIDYDQSVKSIPINQWFQIEAYYAQSATGNGHITIWFDGTQIFDVPNITTMFADATEAANWSVNNYTDKLNPPDATIYVDDMTVSTTRIGTGGPIPTASPVPTQASVCQKKSRGDANCDGYIDGVDFSVWLNSQCHRTSTSQTCSDIRADFNGDGNVDDIDYTIWVSGEAGTASTLPSPTRSQPSPTLSAGSWWKPTADKPIQLHWQLSSDFNPATDFVPEAKVYDIDGEQATAETVAAIHARGFIAICYIDVGVYETYRNDADKFPQSVIGKPDEGWDGSYWLDIRQLSVLQPIMHARIQMCKDKGFDAVEPDEENGFDNDSGFPLTYQDQLTYNKWIADTVHSLGMSVGLKSDQAQAADLVNWYDWNLTEECYQYHECNQLQPFKQANKATWIVEYATNPDCTNANSNHYNAIRRDLDLVGPHDTGYYRSSCIADGTSQWP